MIDEMVQQNPANEQDSPAGAENQLALDCKEHLLKAQEQLLRLSADFENFRRNVDKERPLWSAAAQASLLRDLLPVVDNFERAFETFKTIEQPTPSEIAHQQGIELIYRALLKIFEKYGVTEIKTDGLFDPALHEALVSVPGTDKPAGTIMTVIHKGYMHGPAVLRAAQVSVAA